MEKQLKHKMRLNIVLLKNKKEHYHLTYIIENQLLIDPTYNGLQFYNCNFEKLTKFKEFLEDYKIVDNVVLDIDEAKRKVFLKPFIFNCISFGKLMTGQKGLFFSCKSFIQKLKEKQNG